MLILPMATNNSMFELEVSFHNIYKEKMKLQATKNSESDVLIGKYSIKEFPDVKYYKDQPARLTRDIRNISSYYNNEVSSIKVVGEKYNGGDFCDQYSIPLPPAKANIYVDTLYGLLVNNLRYANPNKKKDRVIALKNIGVINSLNEHEQIKLLELRQGSTGKTEYIYQLNVNGLEKQAEWLEFMETLDFTTVPGSVREKDNYEQVLRDFGNVETKLKKEMNNYLTTGEENYLIYSYYYQLLNNRQYTEFRLPQKQYVKEKVA